jgi:hypothetical protein
MGMNFLKRQWEQIAGNVKYGAIVFVGSAAIAGFGIVTDGLKWWQQAIVVGLFSIVSVWAVVVTALFLRRPETPKTATSIFFNSE